MGTSYKEVYYLLESGAPEGPEPLLSSVLQIQILAMVPPRTSPGIYHVQNTPIPTPHAQTPFDPQSKPVDAVAPFLGFLDHKILPSTLGYLCRVAKFSK